MTTMAMRRSLTVLCLTLVCLLGPASSFSVLPKRESRHFSSQLGLVEDEWIGQPTLEYKELQVDSLHKKLQERQEELKRGIGKRFVVKTQKGFLNVHSSLDQGPFCTDNIIDQLHDGQVITSKNIVGSWIQHEAGWSMARYGGFTFLQPLEE